MVTLNYLVRAMSLSPDQATNDRICELICHIVSARPEAVAALTGLLGLFSHMCSHLSVIDRQHFSACLHEVADDLVEHKTIN